MFLVWRNRDFCTLVNVRLEIVWQQTDSAARLPTLSWFLGFKLDLAFGKPQWEVHLKRKKLCVQLKGTLFSLVMLFHGIQ